MAAPLEPYLIALMHYNILHGLCTDNAYQGSLQHLILREIVLLPHLPALGSLLLYNGSAMTYLLIYIDINVARHIGYGKIYIMTLCTLCLILYM